MKKPRKKVVTLENLDLNSSEERAEFAKRLCTPLIPKKCRKPKGTKCTKCNSGKVEVWRAPVSGPYTGTVKCQKCGHQESICAHLGKRMLVVEPLK